MPKVNGKEYPYTKAGIAAAKKAAAKKKVTAKKSAAKRTSASVRRNNMDM